MKSKRRRRKCGRERPGDPRNTALKVSFLAQLCLTTELRNLSHVGPLLP